MLRQYVSISDPSSRKAIQFRIRIYSGNAVITTIFRDVLLRLLFVGPPKSGHGDRTFLDVRWEPSKSLWPCPRSRTHMSARRNDGGALRPTRDISLNPTMLDPCPRGGGSRQERAGGADIGSISQPS